MSTASHELINNQPWRDELCIAANNKTQVANVATFLLTSSVQSGVLKKLFSPPKKYLHVLYHSNIIKLQKKKKIKFQLALTT